MCAVQGPERLRNLKKDISTGTAGAAGGDLTCCRRVFWKSLGVPSAFTSKYLSSVGPL